MQNHHATSGRAARAGALIAALLAVVAPLVAPVSSHAEFEFVSGGKLSGSGGATEPGIDIAPDGRTIFVNGINGIPSHSLLWRSDDGGSSFKKLTFPLPYSRFPGGGDADVVVGEDGHVYFLDLWAGSNSIAYSPDLGENWTQGTPFTTLPLSDRQWISLGERNPETGLDTVYVAYHFIQPPQSLMLSRSDDSGLTWTWHVGVPGLVGTGALPGQIVSDGKWVAFNYVNGRNMYIAMSADAGVTWTKKQVSWIPTVYEGSLTAVAQDPMNKDDLYIAWIDDQDFSVRVGRSYNRGQDWEWGEKVSGPEDSEDGMSNIFPWIAARDGKVSVAWYGADEPGDPNNVSPATEWRVRYAESTDRGATFGAPVDATGVVKRGFICTQGLSCNAGRELGDFLQIALDGDSNAMISYVDVVDRKLAKVVRQRPL
ncbi:MAG: sialidase family protein [Actinomycetota bacterium]